MPDRVYRAEAWSIRCVSVIRGKGLPRGVLGLAIPMTQTILLRRGQAHPLWTLAHELSHAYSVDRLSVDARASFARRVGRTEFFARSGTWASNPAEIWANNQARCAGYPNTSPTRRVPCRVIRRYLRAAADDASVAR
ncbi:hypothetical protein [Nocardioides sp.]|uniref:hypothetical protein n=1 Tax=Nocardioides sp. TaxID=35761 RepID=UPI003D1469A9